MRFFRGIVVLFLVKIVLRWNVVEKYLTTPKLEFLTFRGLKTPERFAKQELRNINTQAKIHHTPFPQSSARPIKTYFVVVVFLVRAARLCSDTGSCSSKPIICTLPPVVS